MATYGSTNANEDADYERELDKAQLSELLAATNKSKDEYTTSLSSLKTALSLLEESSPYVMAVKNNLAQKLAKDSCDGKYDGIIYEITWYMYQ